MKTRMKRGSCRCWRWRSHDLHLQRQLHRLPELVRESGGGIVKQHLSVEQVTSLSPEAQRRLREWWKPNEGDVVLYNECASNPWLVEGVSVDGKRVSIVGLGVRGSSAMCAVGEMLPLLSIGQCIQFLTEQYYSRRLTWMERVTARVVGFTSLQAVWRLRAPSYHKHDVELIDALFLAVKDVLEVGRE